MRAPVGLSLAWWSAPDAVDAEVRRELIDCWRDVSNAGGAVGFPFLPVADEHVAPAVDELIASLDADVNRLLTARVGPSLAGWLLLAGNDSRLMGHWATVKRVQTALDHRGNGVGRALMNEVARAARHDLGLRHLHLDLRSGLGLEEFYRSCGWVEVGVWSDALCIGDGVFRDSVLMQLTL